MALYFLTDDPAALLEAFKAKINQRDKQGRIETWEEFGDNFGHTSTQWKDAAQAVPSVITLDKNPALKFHFEAVEGGKEFTAVAYAEYHGTLLQTFITHLSDEFKSARFIDRRNK